ncbi:hypothetical protein KRMM14A1004_41210 [Krasilnikovia sp. MM14-A1004]
MRHGRQCGPGLRSVPPENRQASNPVTEGGRTAQAPFKITQAPVKITQQDCDAEPPVTAAPSRLVRVGKVSQKPLKPGPRALRGRWAGCAAATVISPATPR